MNELRDWNATQSNRLGRELKQTAVIIPARNEERSIGFVLDDLPAVRCVIVVDNGSIDRTAAVANSVSSKRLVR